jgi:O-acetylhomoserine (thiol)-lyase
VTDPGFDTLALHAGAAPDPGHRRARGAHPPEHQLRVPNSEHAASLFNMERSGHVYSRISNPTNAVLEERVAALEGGSGAIATASGQAALHLAIATLAGAGSHIVASSALYGGSHNLLHYTLARFGITPPSSSPATGRLARGHPARDAAAVRRDAGQPGAGRAGHPGRQRHRARGRLPLLVDSTFTTPWLMKPFEHGADLVYHSATKFLCGHGTVVGGVLVDSGRFDWAQGRFPGTEPPYAGFHGMVFSEESTVGAFLLRARREGLRDFGACMSPHTAWLILQGIETLPLRMARHVENTRRIVAFLAAQPMVQRVGYPELDGHPSQALAKRLLPRGCGAVFSFDLKGSPRRARPSSRRSSSSATWPTSATAARWSSTRPAPRTSAWTTRRWRRRHRPRHHPPEHRPGRRRRPDRRPEARASRRRRRRRA